MDEVVADEASGTDHVVTEAVPDVGAGDLEDGLEVAAQGAIDIGTGAPGVGGVEHPAEADVILLVVVDGDSGTDAARGEHGACHKFEGNAVFDEEASHLVACIGHGGLNNFVGVGGDAVGDGGGGGGLLNLGQGGGGDCE